MLKLINMRQIRKIAHVFRPKEVNAVSSDRPSFFRTCSVTPFRRVFFYQVFICFFAGKLGFLNAHIEKTKLTTKYLSGKNTHTPSVKGSTGAHITHVQNFRVYL